MCVKLILQASTWTKCPPGSSLPNVKPCQRCIKRCQSSQFWRDFLPSGRHEASLLLYLCPRLSSGIGMSLATQMYSLWKYSLMTYLFPFQSVWVKPLIQETYTETRDITDSAGNTFSCLYTIVYDPSRKVLGQFFSANILLRLSCPIIFSLQGGL